jgi:hypothetical protein
MVLSLFVNTMSTQAWQSFFILKFTGRRYRRTPGGYYVVYLSFQQMQTSFPLAAAPAAAVGVGVGGGGDDDEPIGVTGGAFHYAVAFAAVQWSMGKPS